MSEEVTKALEYRRRLTREITEQEQLIAKAQGEFLSSLQKEHQLRENIANDLAETRNLLAGDVDERVERMNQEMAAFEVLEEKYGKLTDQQEARRKTIEEIQSLNREEQDELKKQLEIEVKILAIRKKQAIAANKTAQSAAGFLGISQEGYDSLLGSVVLGIKEGENLAKTLIGAGEEIGKSFADAFAPMNMLNTFVENTQELAMQMDNVSSEFVAATGASREYGARIRDLGMESMEFGVDIEGISASMQGLYQSFTSFSHLAEEQQDQLAKTGGLLAKVGIDAQTFGSIMNSLTKGLGMSMAQAEKTVESFATDAAQLGMAPDLLAKNFTSLMPKMSRFGDRAKEVFITSAKTAKALGLEMQELLDITEQFNTFDQAAQAVGGLNAILGGSYLDTVSMVMETDPTKRIIMMKDAFDAAGQAVDDLGYYQKLALAQQMGFGDNVDAFSKAMRSSTGELMAQNAEQKKLEDIAKDATSVMDKLTMAMNQLMIAIDPLVDGLRVAVEWFMKISKNDSVKWFLGVTGAVSLLTFTMLALGAVYGQVVGGISKLLIAIGLKMTATEADTLATGANGVAAQIAEAKWARFKATLLGVGQAFAGLAGFAVMASLLDSMGDSANRATAGWLALSLAIAAAVVAFMFGTSALAITAGWAAVGVGAAALMDLVNQAGKTDIDPGAGGTYIAEDLIGYQSGVDGMPSNIPGGMFVAGEGGPGAKPELIVRGTETTNVINNRNTEALMAAAERGVGKKETSDLDLTALVSAVKENTKAVSALNKNPTLNNQPAPTRDSRPIILKLDEREVGRFVDGHLQRKHDFAQ